ncbi:group III truncated hemoglobin [Azospirillum tabaci]|uniref:group III truncated hemoglobin n=1 Tax=Azospirillum tabaci TaxID=2752310 RepID=UPI0016605B33|nr:group III truncated hemoglobin [Azospirillum tabaci]
MDQTAVPTPQSATIAERVAKTGIDEAMIEALVRTFYGKIRGDALLGPVFGAAITDWEPHLLKMIDFWSSVALLTHRYDGRPLPAHIRFDIGPAHFERWLELFRETTAEVCTPEAAAFFEDRAANIGRSIQMGVDFFRKQAAADAGTGPGTGA